MPVTPQSSNTKDGGQWSEWAGGGWGGGGGARAGVRVGTVKSSQAIFYIRKRKKKVRPGKSSNAKDDGQWSECVSGGGRGGGGYCHVKPGTRKIYLYKYF